MNTMLPTLTSKKLDIWNRFMNICLFSKGIDLDDPNAIAYEIASSLKISVQEVDEAMLSFEKKGMIRFEY